MNREEIEKLNNDYYQNRIPVYPNYQQLGMQSKGQVYLNEDEKLFRDANRPRDEFGFKIMPGGQTAPIPFGTGVKGFYLDQFVAMGIKIIPSIKLGDDVIMDKIPLSENLTAQEIKDISDYMESMNLGNKTDGFLDKTRSMKSSYKKLNKGNCGYIKDGKIYLNQSGTYNIGFYSTFNFRNSFDSNRLPYQKIFTGLHSNGNEIQRFGKHIMSGGSDTTNATQLSSCLAGDTLEFGARHTAGDKTLVVGIVNVIRLGL